MTELVSATSERLERSTACWYLQAWIKPDIPPELASRIDNDLYAQVRAPGATGLAQLGGVVGTVGIFGLALANVSFPDSALLVVGIWPGMFASLFATQFVSSSLRTRRVRAALKARGREDWVVPFDDLKTLGNLTYVPIGKAWDAERTFLISAGAGPEVILLHNEARDAAFDEYMNVFLNEYHTTSELNDACEVACKKAADNRAWFVGQISGSETKAQLPVSTVKARARLDAIRELYGAYLSDPLEVLTYPALNDIRVKETAEFVRAYTQVSDLDGACSPSEFNEAVSVLDQAWLCAWQETQRQQDTFLPIAERVKLRRAHALISRALDPAASPQERQSSWEGAKRTLVGVLVLPRPAMSVIETPLRGLA